MQHSPRPGYCTGYGQTDTHAALLSDGRPNPHGAAGTPYETLSSDRIAAMVKNPPSVGKDRAQWFLPSSYHGADARSHAAQRQNGDFWWLTLDVDEGNLALEALSAALVTVLGKVARAIYATRSATQEARKWRALVPLANPVSGADFADTQTAYFDLLAEQDVIADRALCRPGQLVYLPNRGAFYQRELTLGTRLDLDQTHPVILRRDTDRKRRAEAEAMARTRRERRSSTPTLHGAGGCQSPIEAYNAQNDLADVLERYGWQRLGQSPDFRSPFQTSSSFATRITGETWVSLSASDAAAGIGAAARSGAVYGDAFDVYVHFEHGGDFESAVRAAGSTMCNTATSIQAGWPVSRGDAGGGLGAAKRAAGGDGADRTKDPAGAVDGASRAAPGLADWPDPDWRLTGAILPPPPSVPLSDVLGSEAARWVEATADGAGAPVDFVFAGLLAVTGATMGNARWVSPWQGWSEPPLVWSMCVGNPSAGKSPALKAVLAPLRRAERLLREDAVAEHDNWARREKLVEQAHKAWSSLAQEALRKGNAPPALPPEAESDPEPHIPRLVVNDGTVERLGVIAAAQPKGFLQFRDELSGWLLTMEARNAGSDRAFWLEAYGGQSFTVERMGRRPLSVERLSIGVCGGIQPDRLNELLTKATDDGLLARFLPVWPAPIPVKRPETVASDAVADAAMRRLIALDMPTDEDGEARPWFATFDENAQALMDDWRRTVKEWEADSEGLLLSFIGKLPGMAARLALVLAALDHAFDSAPEPNTITVNAFGRACHLLETYSLPMARRAYAAASVPQADRSARRLLAIVLAESWTYFTSRDAMRHERTELGTSAKLDPALAVLLEGDCIRPAAPRPGPRGGRQVRAFDVNPALLSRSAS